jgi:phosphatidylserine/phosphatidylglycerophosphate/cardiolipin synthase-like enzyme
MHHLRVLGIVLACALGACATTPGGDEGYVPLGGKADGEDGRSYEVILTEPYCNVCSPADKEVLRDRSPIVARVLELIDEAETSIDVAQFTFSDRRIEEALIAAHAEGIAVRVAMNVGQDREGTLSRRLADAGLNVKFVPGRIREGSYDGLQHAKFMIVDGTTLLTGSNNWSSTGTSINEENTIVIRASSADDALLSGFRCHYDSIWNADPDAAVACSNDEAAFTPGTAAMRGLRDAIRASQTSIDVLMHHFTFDDLVKELAKAAERGVRVRVIVNAADREEHTHGRQWERLFAAGGLIRFKESNEDAYQLMHHKLAIIDGRILLNGSGNWSGSAFFNNYENYVRYEDPRVTRPFVSLFTRLWSWSLTGESLDADRTPAEQDAETTHAFFGNLHAHFTALDGEDLRDDGLAERQPAEGADPEPVDVPADIGGAARFAYEYARDRGRLDFLALSPHTTDFRAVDAPDMANMDQDGYDLLLDSARAVSEESAGEFLAIPAMEWSTNSSGNHVNVFGSEAIANVERGRFDLLYGEFLPHEAALGGRPLVMLNHPRTMRVHEEYLSGSWDQIFGVALTEIENNSQRNKKFNDYGLDDFAPMNEVRDAWIAGLAMPELAVVDETLANLRAASDPYVRLMEVTVARGKEIGHEHSQNPSLSEDEDGVVERYTKVHRDFDYYLLHGFHLAPTASHDNHEANWGTGHSSRTVLFAEALSEDALLSAIDARAVYASEDENLTMRFYANGYVPMGGETGTTEDAVPASLTLTDQDYAGELTVRVYRGMIGGDEVRVVSETTVAAGTTSLSLPTDAPGSWFFYVEVHEPSVDRMAWSAPIWIERY